jgi:hypothetical protein
VDKHIFQVCPVWIYTQSNITSIIFTWVHYTNTEKKNFILLLESNSANRPLPLWVKFWSRQVGTKISSQFERASQN